MMGEEIECLLQFEYHAIPVLNIVAAGINRYNENQLAKVKSTFPVSTKIFDFIFVPYKTRGYETG